MPARFYEQDVQARLKGKRRLSAFLDSLVQQHRPGTKQVRLDYIFCSDAFLLEMNRQFLDHDTLTDIITFDLAEDPGILRGEIYISTDRVLENASKFRTSYPDELHRVIFHGVLHLCGFKDKKKADREQMRRQEDLALEAYGRFH